MPSRRVPVALLCCVLVVTAGCAGLSDTGGQPTTDGTTTATPTETTTESTTQATTAQPAQLAPGLTRDGVADALALADAHREFLETHQFVKRTRTQRENPGDWGWRASVLAYANESHWKWNTTGEELPVAFGVTNGSYALFADGHRVLYRLRADGNVTYGVARIGGGADSPPTPPRSVLGRSVYERGLVYTLLSRANVTVERGDGVAARVTGTADEFSIGGETVTDVEFTAAVRSSGLVERLELTYERGNATVKRSIIFDADVTDPLERPAWYDTALNRTNE
ncbi:MAG: hypothetical protein ABEJ88_00455 [Halobacterium sp.]